MLESIIVFFTRSFRRCVRNTFFGPATASNAALKDLGGLEELPLYTVSAFRLAMPSAFNCPTNWGNLSSEEDRVDIVGGGFGADDNRAILFG